MLAADAADLLPTAPHALFAPGTSDAYIAQFESAGDVVSGFANYQAAQRWTDTSTGADSANWGDATTLTWSIAPDGTSIPGFAGESSGGSNFIATMKSIYGSVSGGLSKQPWFQAVSSVFARWSQVSGITFVYEPHDDGAAFSSIASSAPGVAGVRGDIRIGGHAIDGDSGTLAYNFFPNNGEMILDTSDGFFRDTSGDSLRLRNVMAHEAGHGIGLAHVAPVDGTKLMEPYASTTFDGPQLDDILAAERLYGDRYEAGAGNDAFSTATNLGDLTGRSVVIGDNSKGKYLSIDGSADVDYLHFTAAAGTTLDATLTPLGGTYQQGGQGGAISSFNAQAQNNLALDIYDNRHTLVVTVNSGGLGKAETLHGVKLQAGGDYYFRVRGDRDAAQLYRIDVTVDDGALAGTIDFSGHSIDAYGGSQDYSGTAKVEEGGAALRLTGNRWKKVDLPYTVTPNTVLEFDFTNVAKGEIQGIGFDSNTSISSSLTFRLAGTQNWGIGDFASSATGTRHVVIPVGKYYTGKATVLFFTNDHDVANPSAESVFRDVRVYESDSAANLLAPPSAVADQYSVNENSATVSLNVLKNDDSAGGSLTITGVSAASAGGSVSIAADQTLHYRPASNFSGTETFTYTIRSGGGNSTATVTVNVKPAVSTTSTASLTSINFNNYQIDSYGGAQDFGGTAVVGNGGQSLRLTGNTWKKIDVAYTITPGTVLEFDFSSNREGEVHGIGLDNDASISAARTFQLFGTQRWGLSAFDTYAASNDTRHYVIPIGRYYTGSASHLFFTNDDDVSNPTAVSIFSNVRLYDTAAVDRAFAELGGA